MKILKNLPRNIKTEMTTVNYCWNSLIGIIFEIMNGSNYGVILRFLDNACKLIHECGITLTAIMALNNFTYVVK